MVGHASSACGRAAAGDSRRGASRGLVSALAASTRDVVRCSSTSLIAACAKHQNALTAPMMPRRRRRSGHSRLRFAPPIRAVNVWASSSRRRFSGSFAVSAALPSASASHSVRMCRASSTACSLHSLHSLRCSGTWLWRPLSTQRALTRHDLASAFDTLRRQAWRGPAFVPHGFGHRVSERVAFSVRCWEAAHALGHAEHELSFPGVRHGARVTPVCSGVAHLLLALPCFRLSGGRQHFPGGLTSVSSVEVPALEAVESATKKSRSARSHLHVLRNIVRRKHERGRYTPKIARESVS